MALYTARPPVATDSHGSAAESVPADLDPTSCPIISLHWFGVPPRAIGSKFAEIVASPRRQRAAEYLHDLGPRPVLEALVEVEAGADLDRVLADFAQIDIETVRQLDGDKFWPAPLREVGS
jgi:hypothetical protein